MKKDISECKLSLYEIFRVFASLLSRDESFDLNLRNAVDYCYKINSHELLTTAVDPEEVVDFPADRNDLISSAVFFPNNDIEVSNTPAKESENLCRKSHFENKSTNFTLADIVKEKCWRLKNAIDQYVPYLNLDSRFHLQRIIFLGQIGSGRKTQARLLAKRWHLVFLDFRIILLEYAKQNKRFGDFFTKVRDVKLHRKLMASILFERVTKRDCLENGWILVGYVSSAADMEIMEKQFHIIPNKIVFIHCRQHLCLDRLRARIIKNAYVSKVHYSDEDIKYAKLGFLNLYSPCYAVNYIVGEIDRFCKNRREILKYCQDRAKYMVHIDGEHCVSTVATLVGQLEKFNF